MCVIFNYTQYVYSASMLPLKVQGHKKNIVLIFIFVLGTCIYVRVPREKLFNYIINIPSTSSKNGHLPDNVCLLYFASKIQSNTRTIFKMHTFCAMHTWVSIISYTGHVTVAYYIFSFCWWVSYYSATEKLFSRVLHKCTLVQSSCVLIWTRRSEYII